MSAKLDFRQNDFYSNMFGEGKTASKRLKDTLWGKNVKEMASVIAGIEPTTLCMKRGCLRPLGHLGHDI